MIYTRIILPVIAKQHVYSTEREKKKARQF